MREANEDKRHSIGSGRLSAGKRKAKIYELYLPLMNKITIILYRGHTNHMQWNIIHPHLSSFEETLAGFIQQKTWHFLYKKKSFPLLSVKYISLNFVSTLPLTAADLIKIVVFFCVIQVFFFFTYVKILVDAILWHVFLPRVSLSSLNKNA